MFFLLLTCACTLLRVGSPDSLALEDVIKVVESFENVINITDKEESNTFHSLSTEFRDKFTSLLSIVPEEAKRTTSCFVLCSVLHSLHVIRQQITKELLRTNLLLTVDKEAAQRAGYWVPTLLNITLEVGGDHISSACACNSEWENYMHAVSVAFTLQLDEEALVLFHHDAQTGKSPLSSALLEHLSKLATSKENVHLFDSLMATAGRMDGPSSVQVVLAAAFPLSTLHCQLNTSCIMYEHLNEVLSHDRLEQERSMASKEYFDPMVLHCLLQCISAAVKIDNKWTRTANFLDLVSQSFLNINMEVATSGWRTSNVFDIAHEQCGLPQIHISQLGKETFRKLFVDLSIPVVIKGATQKWRLWQDFKRSNLLQAVGDIDVLGGSIPYGDIFGESHGYSTVQEFVQYMDEYSNTLRINGTGIAAPLYVFDPHILKEEFTGHYFLPEVLHVWQCSTVIVPQFILGPPGSGAPFHFHCPAFNAVIYGRKRWFLVPPGEAFYSKIHPLYWQFKDATEYVECVQGPGDLLFVPEGWGHSTLNLDETIAIALEVDHQFC